MYISTRKKYLQYRNLNTKVVQYKHFSLQLFFIIKSQNEETPDRKLIFELKKPEHLI